MRTVAFFLLLFLVASSHAQDRDYVTKLVNTLASPEYHGRGYVEKGDIKAATFIAKEMSDMELRGFTDSYLQRFPININTFPGKMSLSVNGQELKPGEDYIVDPASPAFSGSLIAELIDRTKLKEGSFDELLQRLEKQTGKIYILDLVGIHKDSLPIVKELKNRLRQLAPMISVKEKKLTWSASTSQNEHVAFSTLKDRTSFANGDEIQIEIDAKQEEDFLTQNVIGYVPGKCKRKDWVLFTAHYDHLGRMGKDTYFPGANDNASGTAMILSLAKHFSENQPKRTMCFIAFGAEEAGIIGSNYYVANPAFPLENIRFVLNLDIFGTGDEGITAVNATEFPKEFTKLRKTNEQGGYLKKVKKRGKAQNSDHYWFTEAGVPAFFIYTMGGIKAYHDVYDKAETLPLTEYEDLFNLLLDFSTKL